jgi:hypothetical protein
MGSSGKQPQRDDQEQQVELQGDVPRVMVEQAEAAASNTSSGPQSHYTMTLWIPHPPK